MSIRYREKKGPGVFEEPQGDSSNFQSFGRSGLYRPYAVKTEQKC